MSFAEFSQDGISLKYAKYSKEGYAIEYPETWQIDTSNRIKVELSLFSPKESEIDSFSENVNLIVRDLALQHLNSNTTLDEFEKFSESQITKFAENLKGFSAKKIVLNNTEGYEINFDMTYQKYRLHTRQYYFIKNARSIVLTFSCEQEKLEKYQPIWIRISNSFILNT